MKSTFASLLGRAVEEVFKIKGWMTSKAHITKLKHDLSLFEELLQNGGDAKCKLMADARATDEEKGTFLLQQYQRFEQYMYWFLGEMVFKDHCNCLDNHKDYVLNDIMKPKSMSIIAYLSCVNYMYEIIPYLQAPMDEGETARQADYKALLAEANMKMICRAQ